MSALLVAGFVTPAAADDVVPAAPTPALRADAPAVARGHGSHIVGSGFTPGVGVSVETTAGLLRRDGVTVDRVTADADGKFWVSLVVGTSIPLTTSSAEITATADSQAPVRTTVALAGPTLATMRNNVCPGRSATLETDGFPDGTWTVSSTGLAPARTTVRAEGGRLPLVVRWADGLPASASVHVEAADGSADFDYAVARSAPVFHLAGWIAFFPFDRTVEVDCMRPHEMIDFSALHPRSAPPAPVHAGADGTAEFHVTYRAAARAGVVPGVRLTGRLSRQTSISDPVRVWGTTLRVGQQLVATSNGLMSPNGRYALGFNPCSLDLWDGGSVLWRPVRSVLRRDDCTAALTTSGDFVIRDHRGAAMWSAGTAGTGHANRVVLRDDGRVAMYTSANHEVWSSRSGIVRTPSTIGHGQSLARGQALTLGSTRLKLRRSGNLVVERGRATVWQSRTANRGVASAQLTRAGRLILRTAKGRVVWKNRGLETGIAPHLAVRADGDVVITGAPTEILWHTRTARRS